VTGDSTHDSSFDAYDHEMMMISTSLTATGQEYGGPKQNIVYVTLKEYNFTLTCDR
jgi:hypothetical protein